MDGGARQSERPRLRKSLLLAHLMVSELPFYHNQQSSFNNGVETFVDDRATLSELPELHLTLFNPPLTELQLCPEVIEAT
jgi:hypothetical protein